MCPVCRWIPSGSFGCAMFVARFVFVLLVRPSAPWWSMRSFGLVCFVQVRVARILRDPVVRSGAP